MSRKISCTWMRGGTSKAGCFLKSELPTDIAKQDYVLCRIFGSNDTSGRQIDGMGGGTSTTSKAMIIEKGEEKNSVNYTFAQVDTQSIAVDRKGNCGNISSAVAPFAIDSGLIDEITEPVTRVTIFNTNTKKQIIAHVPVKNGKVIYHGDYAISGVPGTAAKIQLDFLQPAGAVTGKLLPTGNVKDCLDVPKYGQFEVSIVDAANPLVFIKAEDVGLVGNELPQQIDSDDALLNKLLAIREAASVAAGIAKNNDEAKKIQAVPKFCFIAPAQDYQTLSGETVKANHVDLLARMLSMGKLHPALAITGGVCIAVAAKISGTLVNEVVGPAAERDEIRIGHCSGILSVNALVKKDNGQYIAEYGSVYRTARVLIKGEVEMDEE